MIKLAQLIDVSQFCQIISSRFPRKPMHYVVATGIRIVGKIEMRDFEINAKSFSEKAHTIVRCLKSLNRTERDVRDDAIVAALQGISQR